MNNTNTIFSAHQWAQYLTLRPFKRMRSGVPVMAQGLRNPTSIHEDAGLISGLAQWVKDPAFR